MTFAVSPRRPSLRAWLLAEVPRSRRQARLGGLYAIWLAFRANPLALTGLAIVVLLILAAMLAPLLGAGAAFDQDLARRLSPPGAAHSFGTADLGRDILSPLVAAPRVPPFVIPLVA